MRYKLNYVLHTGIVSGPNHLSWLSPRAKGSLVLLINILGTCRNRMSRDLLIFASLPLYISYGNKTSV